MASLHAPSPPPYNVGMTLRLGGIVLCGGQSRRMGAAKEWQLYGTECALQRVVRLVDEALRQIGAGCAAPETAGPLVVAARPGQSLPELPAHVRVVHDEVAGIGPLAGVAAGLAAVTESCDAALLASVDTPLLRTDVLAWLAGQLGEHQAVVARVDDRVQPLPGVYRVEVATLARDLLRAPDYRDRSLRTLLARADALIIEPAAWRSVDPAADSWRNVNTPAEYEAARAQVDQHS